MTDIRVLAADDAEGADLVTRMCMETVLETIPEFGGSEETARRYLSNFDFEQMRAMIGRSATLPEHRIFIATCESVIVGYSITSLKTSPEGVLYGYLFSRGVAVAHRRQGVATRLLMSAEEWFRQSGAAYVRAETHEGNLPLRELLTRHGYVVVERAEGAWPYVVLQKRLEAAASSMR